MSDVSDIQIRITDNEEVRVRTTVPGVAIPGPRGQQGQQGVPGTADPDQLEQAVGDYLAENPRELRFESPGPVSEWTVNHGLPYEPNVTVVDSAGREMGVPIQHLIGAVYIDIRPSVVSLTAILS